MQNPVLIFGANYLGRLVSEIFELNNVVVYGYLDDNKFLHNTELDDKLILGSTDDENFLKLLGKKCECFIAIDDTRLKKSIIKTINETWKVQPVNAIHRTAMVSSKSTLGHGNMLDSLALVSAGTKIGNHNLMHAGTMLGVDCSVGDFVQIGVGTKIGNEVEIGDEVFIGAGATIVSGVKIGKGARIGAGSVVVASIGSGDTVFGNPAQKVKS